MSPREIIAWLRGSVVHLIILGVGVLSAWILVGKFKSGELDLQTTSLEEEVAKKEERLEEIEKRLALKRDALAKKLEMEDEAVKMGELKIKLKELQASNAAAKSKLASLNEGLVQTEEMFDDYRQRYRKHIRDKATGTKMDELTILGGKTYQNVEIKSVGALGVNITHQDGSRRIPFKELPLSMQKQFQFDEEEAEAQLQKEAELRRQHRLAQAAALRAAEDNIKDSEPEPKGLSDDEFERAEKNLEAAIAELKNRLSNAQANLRKEGSKKLSRAPQYRTEIKELEAALKKNQARLSELRSRR